MNLPLLSFIVPVYNGEKYIESCLNSVLHIDSERIEVIVIDDGSKDSTREIVEKIASHDSRVRLISQENHGVSSARNCGIEAALGGLITFVDADDNLVKEYPFDDIISLMQKYDTLWYDYTAKPKLKIKGEIKTQKEFNKLLSSSIKDENLNSTCNKIYRKGVIKKHNIRFNQGITMSEDLLFNVQYLPHCSSIYVLDQIGYIYRSDNSDSATKGFTKNKYSQLMQVNDALRDWAVTLRSKKLLQAVDYIRLKNVLSCTHDLLNQNEMSDEEKIITVQKYKQENPLFLFTRLNFHIQAIGLAYSLLPPKAVLKLIALSPRKTA